MNNVIYAIFFTFLLISCKDKKQEQQALVENDTTAVQTTQEFSNTENKLPDTIKVDYSTHKDLLHILTLLPDSAMIDWEWKPNDRGAFVKLIKQNNFVVDTTELHLALTFIKPNTLRMIVVDGSWSLSIYKIKPNNYIVIADAINDGEILTAFEYDSGKLKAIKIKDLFGDIFPALLNDKNDTKCKALLNEKSPWFDYNLQDTTKVEISNSYDFREKESKGCFKGNTLNYEFNPTTKKFDLVGIKWTEYKEQ
ncbi:MULTISPECIES: hypothetical protein [unclassified Arcicella]|uniref:hypothetical protein n=1 Tax=unclassified Arcicella TaxID=2644986 RepID=UPI002864F621|nr:MULTISPECIES: hypothetical protein [unclassified Arcicella]MDR6564601.1 hypothetical protein [Arcicella sp. BE51]MDR6814471.1 hypothetical protein [Arcicella sp. BE140]MDR6825773.1 hypothetical protein [Arcicella sp. BE139]